MTRPASHPADGSAPVAVVTGASRGIGAHVAAALESAGWVVERGSSAIADVSDPAAVETWFAALAGRHDRLALLVNNAGVIDAEVPLPESDPDQWWRTVEVNVRGPYLVTRAAWALLVAGSGRVVNLSSGAALRPGALASAYNLSKTALSRLTGSIHLAGLPAFDVAPGVVRTDMTEAMTAHRTRTDWTDPTAVAALVLAIGAGRLDAWSGRFMRAGTDTVDSLLRSAPALGEGGRTVTLRPYGADDPLG